MLYKFALNANFMFSCVVVQHFVFSSYTINGSISYLYCKKFFSKKCYFFYMRIKYDNFVILSLVVLAALGFHFIGIRICPVRHFFGVPCPGCGCTRAFMLLMKGDIARSWHYNPLVILAVLVIPVYVLFYDRINDFISKHKVIVITAAVLLTILLEIHNLMVFAEIG